VIADVITGFEPNPKQLAAAQACLDRAARVVVLDGAIRSGKTQAAARLLVEMASRRRRRTSSAARRIGHFVIRR
jgi:hypothetical protein